MGKNGRFRDERMLAIWDSLKNFCAACQAGLDKRHGRARLKPRLG
jgi:hypothetical protein